MNQEQKDKILFFTKYYGQLVRTSKLYDDENFLSEVNYKIFDVDIVMKSSFLKLKNISNITVEEQEFISKLMNANHIIAGINLNQYLLNLDTSVKISDYLRKQGYALNFMNYSISEMINLGWLKLI